MPELKIIYPLNNYIELIKYDKVFTILDEYKNKKKFIKIYWPVVFPKIDKSLYFSDINRKFLCNISSNKYSKIYSDSCLYDFRYKDIKWFEDNDVCFDLYGYDWNLIKRNNNLINPLYK